MDRLGTIFLLLLLLLLIFRPIAFLSAKRRVLMLRSARQDESSVDDERDEADGADLKLAAGGRVGGASSLKPRK